MFTPNITYYLKYDVTGKVTGIYSDQAMSSALETYSYDESGNRIKTVNANGTTYYTYDASGNVMAIYTGATPAIAEIPFYGSDSRLGTYTVSSGNYVYEMRDNVGSVRAVMNRTKTSSGQADIVTYNDYYPYGSLAQSGGTNYRYDYQGAYSEKDPVTGWNNFLLRMYDGKIGRWLTIDPKGQYSSPYEGMGNNPITMDDPTGGGSDWYWKGLKLVAQANDNVNTLASFLNIPLEQATNAFQNLSNWDGGGLIGGGLSNIEGHYLSIGSFGGGASSLQYDGPNMYQTFDNWMKTHGQVPQNYGWAGYADEASGNSSNLLGAKITESQNLTGVLALLGGANEISKNGWKGLRDISVDFTSNFKKYFPTIANYKVDSTNKWVNSGAILYIDGSKHDTITEDIMWGRFLANPNAKTTYDPINNPSTTYFTR